MLGVLAGPDGLDPRQRASPPAQDYLTGLDAGLDGLTAGVVAEGFAIPGLSQPEVDETVRAAIEILAGAGATVRPVSIPWHRDAMHVWTVIATDGVVTQMIDGNGFGMNWPGRYDPDLIGHYARGRREHADALPETVKATAFCGRYTIDRYGGRYYAMARNLALDLTAAYDAALTGRGRARHAHAADRGHRHPAPRRQPGREHRPLHRDDRQHRSVRRQRASGDLCAGRAGPRAAGGAHDRRPPL